MLKASGWQTTFLAIAFGVIFLMIQTETIAVTDSPLWLAIPAIFTIIFSCLSLATIFSSFFRWLNLGQKYENWKSNREYVKEVVEFIPHMEAKDKEIVAYLLHYNQRTFTNDQDGGYAATLLSKGIVKISARHGQSIDLTRVPFEVPGFIWVELVKRKDQFPYSPPQKGQLESYPWVIPWMAR